jgi:hypothetical protein
MNAHNHPRAVDTAALEAAIVALKPPGVLSIDIRHQYGFDVTMVFDNGKEADVASAFNQPTIAEALAKADASRLRKIAAKRTAHEIAAAEVASWAPASRPGWPYQSVAEQRLFTREQAESAN